MTTEFPAALLKGAGEPLRIVRVTAGPLRPEEVLVRIVAVGICHTDCSVQQGVVPVGLPVVLGHEGSGIVEQVGAAVTDLEPGDSVVLTFLSCGECSYCADSRPAHCTKFGPMNLSGLRGDGTSPLSCDGKPIGGGFFGQSSFAHYSIANCRNVVKVGNDIPLELAGPFACGVQTGAGAVLNTLKARQGESCVVFGGGTVGLSAVMAAAVVGCDPILLIEPIAERRTLGQELGATLTIDPSDGEDLGRIVAATGGGGSVVVETTGIAPVANKAIKSLGHGGRLGLIGLSNIATEVHFELAALLQKGASIHAVIEGDSDPQRFIPALIALHANGQLPVERLVRFYPFTDINQAIADQLQGKTIKPILRFPLP